MKTKLSKKYDSLGNSALLGVVWMVFFRCPKPDEVYQAVRWDIIWEHPKCGKI